jgi:histidine triad (HIT) family protein
MNDAQTKLFEQEKKESPPKKNANSDATCVFCSIVRGEMKSLIVYSDDISLAFLDRKPVFLGHCLVIPLKHYETLADLPRDLIDQFFSNVQLLSKAVERAVGAAGTFVAINNRVSQSVPHLHVHVVPRKWHDGLRGFFWPRQSYASESEALEVQEKVRSAISYLTAK